MLARLSGRTHEVHTAVALVCTARRGARLSSSAVTLPQDRRKPSSTAYCAGGEPADKAGGYAIQGRAAVFVSHLAGSYSGVMGLPLCETWELLAPVLASHEGAGP